MIGEAAMARAKRTAKPDDWYAVRSVFLFGKKRDGKNVFEERIVVFSAKTFDGAFAKACREAKRYAKEGRMKRHPLMEAYLQDGDALVDGYEVWSTLFESNDSLHSFVKDRYARYDYRPDGGPRIRSTR
jgi:hypothetical protein